MKELNSGAVNVNGNVFLFKLNRLVTILTDLRVTNFI
jgi:hypothetical protein